MKEPEEKDFYTVGELAKLLSYSERAVRDMLKHGEIKGVRFREKGPWRIPRAEVNRLRGEQKAIEDLPSVATQLKAQLYIPPPETVRIDDFGEPGLHSFSFREDVFRVIWQNLGYDISKFRVYKESSGIPSGDIKINVAVSDYGDVELCYPVEENPLFQELFSSSQEAREQVNELKLDMGRYLVRCSHIRHEIYKEAEETSHQSAYKAGTQFVPQLQHWPPPLTPNFADLIYRLCIVYRRTSGDYGLPDESRYQIRSQTGYLPPFSRLYLGEIPLANAPDPPPLPPLPGYKRWPHILEGYIKTHRDMIIKWSASPPIRELLELFDDLRRIEAAIKLKLDDIIRGK